MKSALGLIQLTALSVFASMMLNACGGAGMKQAVYVQPFSATTVNQAPFDLAQNMAQKKLTLVNFWATDCSTCKKEIPRLKEFVTQNQSKPISTLGIAMKHDNEQMIKNYTKANELNYAVTWDQQGEFAKAFGGIDGTPTTFLLDSDGQVVRKYTGIPDWVDLQNHINKMTS